MTQTATAPRYAVEPERDGTTAILGFAIVDTVTRETVDYVDGSTTADLRSARAVARECNAHAERQATR